LTVALFLARHAEVANARGQRIRGQEKLEEKMVDSVATLLKERAGANRYLGSVAMSH
jgi:hypothetical protein